MRRRFQGTNALIIHLFSGENQKFWTSRLNRGAYLCDTGVVEALLGGPPCRTVSALRFRPPGPSPVRSRTGPERFGLENLAGDLGGLVAGDPVLFLRQLWLCDLA